MQLAELFCKNGMKAGDAFCNEITRLIMKKGLKKIIETGSYLGLGTTKAIRRGLSGGEDIYSIEVNPSYYSQAQKNNNDDVITFLLGLSVGRPQLPIDITFNVPDTVYVDYLDNKRSQSYQREVNFQGRDHLLDYALSKFEYKPDLVILDSAGHLGLIEFKYLMERVKGDFILALDDTNHVKHYETLQIVKSDPLRYNILFESDQEFGSAIISVSIC